MIEWLLNDILAGGLRKTRSYGLTVVFWRDRGGLLQCLHDASMTLIFGGFKRACEKWRCDQLLNATIFKKFWTSVIRINIRHLKGKNM